MDLGWPHRYFLELQISTLISKKYPKKQRGEKDHGLMDIRGALAIMGFLLELVPHKDETSQLL